MAEKGWRFAAGAARIADETATSGDRKHTSERFCVAVDSNLGAVVAVEEWATDSIVGNEGRIAQAWECHRGISCFLALIACGANMCPEEEPLVSKGADACCGRKEASTCRSKGQSPSKKTHGYVISSGSVKGQNFTDGSRGSV